MSAKRLTEVPTMRKFMASLVPAPLSKTTTIPSTTTSRKLKSGVIDWRLNKPEIISVDGVDLHYTSLRDIMLLRCQQQQQQQQQQDYHHGWEIVASSGGSPRTRIRNHLVEQAARAYLQPLNVECNNDTHFFPWNWQKIMGSAPLTFSMSMPRLLPSTTATKNSTLCGGFMGFFSKITLSRTLKYLLGRLRPQHAGFLKFY